jgi:Zn-dependent oligopeptidase
MSFDLSRQQEELKELEEELSRLNSQFDALLKAQGVTAEFLEDRAHLDNPPPEIRASLEAARAAARRAGEERKGRAQTEAQTQNQIRAPGQRPGAIRL